MEFWKTVTIPLKMRQHLYKSYLSSYDLVDLFTKDVPLPIWDPSKEVPIPPRRFKKKLFDLATRMPMVMNMFERYKMYKKHLREWEKHPLGEAQAYGKIRYLLSNSGKRHVQALGLKDFLLHEYCIDMSELKRPVNRR